MGVESTEMGSGVTIRAEGDVALNGEGTSRGSSVSRLIGDGWGRTAEGFVGGHILASLCVSAGMRHTSRARAEASGWFDDGRRLGGVSEALPLSRSPEDLLRSEPLDQDHRATAAWTEPRTGARYNSVAFRLA